MAMIPGKHGSADVVYLVGGYNMLAPKTKSLTFDKEQINEPTGGLGDNYRDHTPVGVGFAMLDQGGAYFDTTAFSSHEAFSTGQPTTVAATPRVACVAFSGNRIGEPFSGIYGAHHATYGVQAQNELLTRANVKNVVRGQFDEGVILQHLATKTADWNTKTAGDQVDNTVTLQRVIPITSNSLANPSVVTTTVPHGLATGDIVLIAGVSTSNPTINGQRTVTVISTTTFSVPVNVTTGGTGGTLVRANSAGGGVGFLQVTACSGFTNFVGSIEDSADDITYATLLSFTDNVVAPFAERVPVAGVVDRYLCAVGNITGAGSITAFIGFSRG